ncbi:MAG: hypothetical protein Q7R83_04710, partial [bacterium]|nr:hypothetical protein [bacterium]
GAEEATIGATETYQIQWKNTGVPLSAVSIQLTAPSDFSILSTSLSPSDKKAMRWELGAMPVGASGIIELKGVVTGALGTKSGLQAIASYQAQSSDRTHEALAVLPLSYSQSVLDGILDVPVKVFVGDQIMIRYSITNRGNEAMKNLVAFFHPPEGFLLSADVSSTAAGVYVPIPDLAPRASTTVQLVGSFSSDSSGNRRFTVEAGRAMADGQFLAAQKSDAVVPVTPGDLSIRPVVNGASKDSGVKPGERLYVSIGYQNTSAETLKNISLAVRFESFVDGKSATGTSLLDWAAMDLGGLQVASSTKSRVQTITFDKKIIDEFEKMAPGADNALEFSVPVRSLPKGAKDGWVQLTVDADIPMGAFIRRTHTQPLAMRYQSDAAFAGEARYFIEEGAPVGSGPLPPVAKKTTTYRILWRVHKTVHGLSALKATAHLPENVSLVSEKLPKDIHVDTETRIMTWAVDHMDEKTADLEVGFDVQLTPSEGDVGRFARLLDETAFEAKDAQTGMIIHQKQAALNTDLQTDEGARGKGVVRKP